MTIKTIGRARGLIIHHDKALVMKRIKNGAIYYTLCGGKLEPHETPEHGCIREIFEETSLHVTIEKQIFYASDIFDNIENHHFIFLCRYHTGEAKLNGEEIDRMTQDNQYIPTWIMIDEIPNLCFKPDVIAQGLIDYLSNQKNTLTQQ